MRVKTGDENDPRALGDERHEIKTRAAAELDVEENKIVVVTREKLAGLGQQTGLADDLNLGVHGEKLPQRGARRGFVIDQYSLQHLICESLNHKDGDGERLSFPPKRPASGTDGLARLNLATTQSPS